jgi:CreA protein
VRHAQCVQFSSRLKWVAGRAGQTGRGEFRNLILLPPDRAHRLQSEVEKGEEIYSLRHSFFFKKMQIVRSCDVKCNVLVSVSDTNRIIEDTNRMIEDSLQNSNSSVPVMP